MLLQLSCCVISVYTALTAPDTQCESVNVSWRRQLLSNAMLDIYTRQLKTVVTVGCVKLQTLTSLLNYTKNIVCYGLYT